VIRGFGSSVLGKGFRASL